MVLRAYAVLVVSGFAVGCHGTPHGTSDASLGDGPTSDAPGGGGDGGMLGAPVGACSADDWCWSNPLPQGNSIHALSGAANDLWGVGDGGTLVHWDGSVWSVAASPTTLTLTSVWAAGGKAWAAGQDTLLQYDGTSWSAVSLASFIPLAVWGLSASDVWAVGADGQVERWNGASWTASSTGQVTQFASITGTSDSDVWIGGYGSGTTGAIEHWNGATWSPQTLPSGFARPTQVYSASPTDVWAIDGRQALHYDGTSWTQDMSIADGYGLQSVFGSSAADVYIVGVLGLVERWDGSAWTGLQNDMGDVLQYGGWSGGSGDVWIGGESARFASWNGAQWRPAMAGTTSTLADELDGVFGLSATDVWTVGATGVQHWDGSMWTYLPRPDGGDTFGASAIWGTAATDLWIAASEVYHWDGAQWTDVDTGIAEVKAIWGTATTDVWAAGDGAIAHWDGSAWTAANVPGGTTNLAALWGTSTTDVWAVGGTSIAHWDGTSWTASTPPSGTGALAAVWGTSTTDVWAVGGTSILHWDGASWTATTEPVFGLTAIGGTSTTDVWAVGQGGVAFHWDGTAWTAKTTGSANNLAAIWASAAAGVWAVGGLDTILHHD
jgi:hypothetical protein